MELAARDANTDKMAPSLALVNFVQHRYYIVQMVVVRDAELMSPVWNVFCRFEVTHTVYFPPN